MSFISSNFTVKKVEILMKPTIDSLSVIKIEFENCYLEIENNFLFVDKIDGDTTITEVYDLKLVKRIKRTLK